MSNSMKRVLRAFDAWMLDPGWERGKLACEQLTKARIETAADHVDHIVKRIGADQHSPTVLA